MTIITRRGTALLAAGFAALPTLSRRALAAPQVGQAAPDFAEPDQDGTVRRLSDLRGKIVVLEWTNHECPFVRKHYGSTNMQTLQRQAAEQGVIWLSIASSPAGEQGFVTAEQARALTAQRQAAPAAVVLDPSSRVSRAYHASTTPHMFIIGPDGVLRYMGGIDSIRSTRIEDVARAEPFFRTAMEQVASGQAVSRPVTQPYGCVVKYAPQA